MLKLMVMALLADAVAGALVVAVDGFDNDGCNATHKCNLAAAFATAGSAEIIEAAPGNYTGTRNRGISFSAKNVTLRSTSGRDVTFIDALGESRLFSVSNVDEFVVDGFTIVRGGGRNVGIGGAFFLVNVGLVRIVNCRFVDTLVESQLGATAQGGVVHATETTVYMENVDITGAMADSGGALYLQASVCMLLGVTCQESRAARDGGCVYAEGSVVEVSQGRFYNNTAATKGGAIYVSPSNLLSPFAFRPSSLVLISSAFEHNTAAAGGGVYGEDNVTASTVMFTNNGAVEGGGMKLDLSYIEQSYVVVNDCVFASNTGISTGGGLEVATLSFRGHNNVFVSNTASSGAGLRLGRFDDVMELYNNSFIDNEGSQTGGGLNIDIQSRRSSNPVVVDSCRFGGNTVQGGGGALSLNGPVDALITLSNFTTNSAQSGGSVALRGTTSIGMRNCLFDNNEASVGGGLWATDDTVASVNHSHFSSNTAGTYGAAVYAFGKSVLVLSSCAFIDGRASYGGGGVGVDLSSDVSAFHCDFVSNVVADGEGGALMVRSNARMVLQHVVMRENRAEMGGALFVTELASCRAEDAVFLSNTARTDGGAVYAKESAGLNMSHAILRFNAADRGGAVAVAGKARTRFENCTVTDHTVKKEGGGVLCDGKAHVTLLNSTLERNFALEGGALMTASCTLRVAYSVFRSNTATEGGGALAVVYSARVEGTVLTGNSAAFGGGVWFYYSPETRADAAVIDSVFTTNTASGAGGGVYWDNSRPAIDAFCVNCTFIGCVAGGYGNETATRSSLLTNGGCPNSVIASQKFSCRVIVFDYFGSSVRFADGEGVAMQVRVKSANSSANVLGQDTSAVIDGFSVFTELQLQGEDAPLRYTIVFESSPPSTPLYHTMLLHPCEVGWEKTKIGQFFTCSECKAGSYNLVIDGPDGGICKECPKGAICEGGDRIFAAKDFWRDPNSTEAFYQCTRGTCCPEGRCKMDFPCSGPTVQTQREGVLCGQCLEGHDEWGGQCVECPYYKRSSVGVALFIDIVVVFYIYCWGRNIPPAFFIMSNFCQFMPYIVGPSGDQTIYFEMFIWRMDYLYTIFGACPFKIDPLDKLMLNFSNTIIMTGLFIIILVCHKLFRLVVRKDPGPTPHKKLPNDAIFAYLNILSICYVGLIDSSVRLITCRTVGEAQYLKTVPAVVCWLGTHTSSVALPAVAFLFVQLPIWLVLSKYRHYCIMVYQKSLRDSDEANIRDLWPDYRHDRFWWPSMVLLRQTIVVAIFVRYFDDPFAQKFAVMSTMIIIAIMHFFITPFIDKRDNVAESFSFAWLITVSYFEQNRERYLFLPRTFFVASKWLPYTGLFCVFLYFCVEQVIHMFGLRKYESKTGADAYYYDEAFGPDIDDVVITEQRTLPSAGELRRRRGGARRTSSETTGGPFVTTNISSAPPLRARGDIASSSEEERDAGLAEEGLEDEEGPKTQRSVRSRLSSNLAALTVRRGSNASGSAPYVVERADTVQDEDSETPPDDHPVPLQSGSAVVRSTRSLSAHSRPPSAHNRPPSAHSRPPSAHSRPPSAHSRPPSAHSRPPSAHSRPPSAHSRPPSAHSRPPSARVHSGESFVLPGLASETPPNSSEVHAQGLPRERSRSGESFFSTTSQGYESAPSSRLHEPQNT